jgi:outer membrane protein assembly factor BamB
VSPDGSQVAIAGRTWGGRDRDYEITTAVYDSATGHLRWAKRFGGSRNDAPAAVAYDPAGTGLFVTGYGYVTATINTDFVTIGYDAATGQRRWAEFFDGPDHENDRASALALSPDGTTVFVTGRSDTPASIEYDYEVFAYDAATGANIWSTRYSSTQDSDDEPCCIGVSPDGSEVFIAGFTDHGSGTKTYLTMAFHA